MQQNMNVWILDSLPGEPRAGNGLNGEEDHPRDMIQHLNDVPKERACRKQLKTCLSEKGLSDGMASWMSTLAKAHPDGPLTFNINLDGVTKLYDDYELVDTWGVVQSPPKGVDISFVRAERSLFKWAGGDQQRIQEAGSTVHLLKDADHNLHVTNPEGLEEIMAPSMRAAEIEWMKREKRFEDQFFSDSSSPKERVLASG
eukprot:5038210-Pyramimonas_sp.AAC.4